MNQADHEACINTDRYTRHLALPEIGLGGQRRLQASRVLVVGAGGLGSPALMYLAVAGVGTLGIVDCDRVEISNLQRQILHGDADIGTDKAASAAATLHQLNPAVRIELHTTRLTSDNADELIRPYEIVLGCVDNFVARYLISDTCLRQAKTNIFGSVSGFQGQASVFSPGGPCYRCFFRDPPPDDWQPSASEKGIVGAVAGVVGSIQATETIKSLLDIGTPLSGRLLLYDGLAMRFREITIRSDADCPACGSRAKPV